jgi:riboflavin kinase / FMN adenylyltransferase
MKTVLCIEFSKAFSEIPPARFVREVLIEKVRAKKIIVGYDYRFGKRREGDARALAAIGQSFDVEVEVVQPIQIGGRTVSSSKIRELIKEGHVDQASILLGKDYPIIGRVVEGSRRGRRLGFPTANLAISEELYPKTGVYAVEVEWRGKPFNALANVGFNPTFLPSERGGGDKGHLSLEVYILNFNQMIYGEEIEVRFIKRIRDEVRFETPSRLVDQIRSDLMWAEENVFRKRPSPANESTWPTSPI